MLLWHLRIINPLKDEVWKLGSEWLSDLPKAVEQGFELMTAWLQNSTLPQTPRSSCPIISGAGVAETLPCSPCSEEPKNGRAFDLANKDTGHPINFEFQIKSEFYFFSISISPCTIWDILKQNFFLIYLTSTRCPIFYLAARLWELHLHSPVAGLLAEERNTLGLWIKSQWCDVT